MNLFTTLEGSLMEQFFPKGWDLQKIDRCASLTPQEALNSPNKFSISPSIWERMW